MKLSVLPVSWALSSTTPSRHLLDFISHTGCGGDFQTRLDPKWDRRESIDTTRTENTSGKTRPVFHLAHGGCLHQPLLTRPDLDDCSLSYPAFHIAHGGVGSIN
jgi:hypothetical protein